MIRKKGGRTRLNARGSRKNIIRLINKEWYEVQKSFSITRCKLQGLKHGKSAFRGIVLNSKLSAIHLSWEVHFQQVWIYKDRCTHVLSFRTFGDFFFTWLLVALFPHGHQWRYWYTQLSPKRIVREKATIKES